METKDILPDLILEFAVERSQYTGRDLDECRLCLAELILKAAAGCRNGHTEEDFLSRCDMLKKDRTPNNLGRHFLKAMYYTHSNNKPEAYYLMQKYRN